MVISDVKFDTKDNPVLQNSSQDSLVSSKYDCVLGALIIMLGSWKSNYNSGMTNYVITWCQVWYQRWSNPPKHQWVSINVLHVWLCSGWTSTHARELKLAYNSRMTYYYDPWCEIWHQRWLKCPDIQSGTINLL